MVHVQNEEAMVGRVCMVYHCCDSFPDADVREYLDLARYFNVRVSMGHLERVNIHEALNNSKHVNL